MGKYSHLEDDLKKCALITTGHHLPYNPELKIRARELRNNMTPAERKLWYGCLRRFKYPISRQRPIDNYIVDFYCPQMKLVIEVDGDTHFSEEGKIYDEERTRVLESYGLRIIRFSNIDVLESFEGVCHKIDILMPLVRLTKDGQNPFTPFT